MATVMIDVREKDEFQAEHVPDSIHVPLGEFASRGEALLKNLPEGEILILCRSGRRAWIAARQAQGFAPSRKVTVFEGGILEWKRQGRPTVAARKGHFPIMRQVQLVAGLLILTGVVLSRLLHPHFLGLAGIAGVGLTLAGSTGLCVLAEILAKLPWNKVHPETARELCAVSPSGGNCSNSSS